MIEKDWVRGLGSFECAPSVSPATIGGEEVDQGLNLIFD